MGNTHSIFMSHTVPEAEMVTDTNFTVSGCNFPVILLFCDNDNYFQRVELCTINYKNVLCVKIYELSLVTASITSQCT